MSQATRQAAGTPALEIDQWAAANQSYLDGALEGLRLRLRRRTRWLRQLWQPGDLHGHPQVVSDEQADRLLIGEIREAEQQFYQEDREAAAVGRALRKTEQNAGELAAAMERAGAPPALLLLGDLFGLNDFERQVVLLCLAPALDPSFAELYAYVQDHAARPYATPHLALDLFAGDAEYRRLARESFLPDAPLRRFALIELEPGSLPAAALTARPLHMPSRVADYVRGVDRLDVQASALLQPVPTAPLSRSQSEAAERLARMVELEAPGPLVVNLTGAPGVGKQAMADRVCTLLGMRLFRVDPLQLRPGSEQRQVRRLLEREAALSRLAYLVDASSLGVDDRAAKTALRDLVEGLGALLFVGSEERWRAERRLLTVTVPKADAAEQGELWQQALSQRAHPLKDRVEAIVQQFDFGPRAIVEAVAAAEDVARMQAGEKGTAVTWQDLWQACRQQSRPRLDQLARRIEPIYVWEDIVLPDDLLQQLRELAAQVAHRHLVYETWGFGARMSRGRGITALFAGASGTGKSMAAEILANALHLDLYLIDLAGVVSKYIGETEKNLRQVFDAAEESGAILFFDEADALFGKRTEVKDSHDRYANIEVNYLLQRMEAYRGLAILATNRKSLLDTAFLRRLRFLLDFPFPDADSRRRIWQSIFPDEAVLGELDYARLARLEIAGGNIKNIALNAAFLAADKGEAIGMESVMHAARREYAKIDKLLTEAEFGSYYARAER
jgi:ATP-dependent 26S proteasome regulatory subunit